MVKIAIGGSLRFFREMDDISKKLRKNNIEYFMANPSLRDLSDLRRLSEEFKDLSWEDKVERESKIVENFLSKIKKTDILYIVNPDGYVGLHAMGDMFYAWADRKEVYTWQKVDMSWVKKKKDYYEPDYIRLQEYLHVIVKGQMTPDELVVFVKKKEANM